MKVLAKMKKDEAVGGKAGGFVVQSQLLKVIRIVFVCNAVVEVVAGKYSIDER